jgi:hypothetical protein
LQELIQGTVNGLPLTGGQQNRIDAIAFESLTCDEDAMYGYSKALWEYINQSNIDALQIVAEATNFSEQLSKILTAVIPGLELLPVDEILGWVEAFGNYNLEAYESSITIGLEQEIICDLFCLAINSDCSLDFGTVYEYFVDKMGGVNLPTAAATLAEWVSFMIIGSYPNDRIVYLWSAFQLALAFMGQKFLGLSTIERYALFAQSGNPDNDWELLCDTCVSPWTRTFDFTDSVDTFAAVVLNPPNQATAVYVIGEGWTGSNYNSGGYNLTNQIRVWSQSESRHAQQARITLQSDTATTIGIFIYAVNGSSASVESLYAQEGNVVNIGQNQYVVNFDAPTVAHNGYRVDLRSLSGSIEGDVVFSELKLSGTFE